MKPKVFIGSSTERLDLAYAIQENLDFDAEATVWTQGIFKLSRNILDSLIESLEKFDYAIFVFHPDDITQIRNQKFDTVRDNLIFELGLFLGKLGKERVFFLVPQSLNDLRLPTDLLGITPGRYNDQREDNNLQASLGPFCNQVRSELKNFIYQNLMGVNNEPQHIKAIVVEQKPNWEIGYASELLKDRLKPINKTYIEIREGFVIQPMTTISGLDFFDWFSNSLTNFQHFLELLVKCADEMTKAMQSETDAKPIEIKNSVERIIQLCKECISWEYELASFSLPEELIIVQKKLIGVTEELLISPFRTLQNQLENVDDYRDGSNRLFLTITPQMPPQVESVAQDFSIYITNLR